MVITYRGQNHPKILPSHNPRCLTSHLPLSSQTQSICQVTTGIRKYLVVLRNENIPDIHCERYDAIRKMCNTWTQRTAAL